MGANLLLGRSLRLIRTFVRTSAPYVFWAVQQSLWLTALSLVSTIRGSLSTSREMAQEWTETAIRSGLPMQFQRALYMACWTAAFAMNVIGWLLLAHLTVFVVRAVIF